MLFINITLINSTIFSPVFVTKQVTVLEKMKQLVFSGLNQISCLSDPCEYD